ncbi:MAG: phasin family protein [Oricola sp.]
MAKTQTTDTADVFAFPAIDAAPFADQFRTVAEQGLAKSKEAYETMKSSMEEAQKTVESAMETAKAQSDKLSMTAIGAMRANAEAGFAHMEKLLGVKTLAEAFEIQSAFVRKQAEMAVDQAKEMQAVSKDAFDALSAPVKAATEKAMASMKAA